MGQEVVPLYTGTVVAQGEELAFGVGDLDLAGFGLLGYRDGRREDHFSYSGDVLAVQASPRKSWRLNSPWGRSVIWI